MKYYVKNLIILLLCVLVPCITVLVATNALIFDEYRESVSISQLNRLQAIDNTNQLIFDNIEQGASRFSSDPSIKSLVEYNTLHLSLDAKYLVGFRRAMTMLNEFVSTNKLFDSVYLFIDGNDYIISSRDSVVSLGRFLDLDWMSKYDELKTDLSANRLLPAHTIESPYNNSGSGFTAYDRKCLTYVYAITPYISNFSGALVFNIYEDKLLQMYLDPSSGSSIAMFDEDGIWISGISNVNYEEVLNENDWQRIFGIGDDSVRPLENGYFFSEVGTSRYQCTYYYSMENRSVLVSLDDMSLLMKKAASYQLIYIVFLLLLVPFAALLILWASRRLYSPVGNLVRELTASGRLELPKGGKDDWSAILRAVDELLREDRKLFSDREREKLREATFLRILAGDETVDDEEVSIILPHRRNLCILAAIDALDSRISKDKNFDSLIRLLILLIKNELTLEGISSTAMRYEDDTVAVILSTDKNMQIVEQILLSKLAMIQTETSKVMDHTVTFAVSSLKDDPGNVSLSFGQAKNVMQYRFMKGLQSVLFYDRVYSEIEYYNADERLKFIQHCLNSGKKEALLQGIHELVDDIISKGNVSYTYASQILNQLVTALTQYTIKNSIPIEELLGDNTVIYMRLWQNRTLEQARDWFCSAVSVVMEYGNAGAGSKSEYIRQINDYVHEYYHQNITIDNIADHIGISYSYLRMLYKEATGRNLSDYINHLRLQKAKQLLLETNYTVKEIVSMCGFNHERSFFRSFTQIEGTSPSKFKELYKNS